MDSAVSEVAVIPLRKIKYKQVNKKLLTKPHVLGDFGDLYKQNPSIYF